jgi:hypothetical protein
MRLTRIAVIPLILILLLSAVACKANYHQPTPTPYVPPTSTPTSTHVSTPVPTPTSSTSESVPLSVSIDYFWVGCAYGGDVQLVVIVGDEQGGGDSPSYLIPPGDTDYDMGNFALKNTGHQRVFHTASVQGALKINVLAYHRDNSQKDYLNALDMMEWYYGSDSINMLRSLVENMPENDKLIGYYTYTWGPDETWGIGQHSNLGTDGLRIWYSIWSNTDPGPMSQPSIENPDVTIESVTVPSTIHVVNNMFPHTLRIRNNEECEMSINWQAHSSVTGDFDSGTANVPANSYIDVYKEYSYYGMAAGSVELTYTISYGGVVLDTKSVTTVVQ